jgi:heme A synthase
MMSPVPNKTLHWLAILLAIGTLLLIINGAIAGPTVQPAAEALSIHRLAAIPVSVLTLVVVLWLIFTDARSQARALGWITLALAILQDSAGHAVVQAMAPHTAGIAHALMAPMFFAAVVAIALVTSPAWARGPELVSDYGWPSNRTLAIVTPVLVVIQITLGAAFRQGTITLMPHVLGAMLVALVILLQGIFVLQQFPAHSALRLAGRTLLGVAFGQVFLGMTTLIMKSMADENSTPVVIAATFHVTGGAITLATATVLSILVRRNVQPRVEEEIDAPAS